LARLQDFPLTIRRTLALCLAVASAASAAEPTNSEGTSSKAPAGESEQTDEAPPPDTEFSLVPFVGGNSDQGFGGGYIASLARLQQHRDPYLYRIDTTGSATFASGHDGGVRVPYVDVFLRWKFPHLIPNLLGLELRASFTRETNLGYYGLGNAAEPPPGHERGDEYFEHERMHPTLRASFEYHPRPLILSWGVSYTENRMTVPAGTLLAEDMQSDLPYVRELLGNDLPHGVPQVNFGIGWDTRDDESAPVRGWNISQQVDLVPGTFGEGHYSYARWTNTVDAFVPLLPKNRRLVFALRVGTDLLFGHPPFWELPRFDDTFAIGGSRGVRGVPAQRYYGKIKVLSNAELRSELLAGKVLGVERRLGVVAFLDSGRLWADYASHPDLDGTGLGLKYGVGGGLRIASGKTFILRLDLAWSPEKPGTSGYMLAGHMF
jgi:hypothetical protein